MKRVIAKIIEQEKKVEALERFREQQSRKLKGIERNEVRVVADNKKLKENITRLEEEQAIKVKEFKKVEQNNQELNTKVETLESELRNLKAEMQSFVGMVQILSQLQKE
eukprot:675469-Ditylum_brightwellii.AAC.1